MGWPTPPPVSLGVLLEALPDGIVALFVPGCASLVGGVLLVLLEPAMERDTVGGAGGEAGG